MRGAAATARWRAYGPVAAAFLAAVAFVNPLRETALCDDWAYAATARQVLETGRYRLHDWLSASMPFQAWWGAAFARALGFSFSALRLSTLTLAAVGLFAFCRLAREVGISRSATGVLALVWLGSPIVFCHSFSFMTTVPYLACSTLALWLYARAWRRGSWRAALAAALAAAAAMLTRQFALALIGAGGLLWLLERNWTRRAAALYLAGFALPALAALWQLALGGAEPTWAQQMNVKRQIAYWAHPGTVLTQGCWRPSVALPYLGLFSLPLLFAWWGARRRPAGTNQAAGAEAGPLPLPPLRTASVALVAALVGLGALYARVRGGGDGFMPYLRFHFAGLRASAWRLPLSAAAAAAGILVGAAGLQRLTRRGWACLSRGERLLDLFAVLTMAEYVLCVDFVDEYLAALLPYALIVGGRQYEAGLLRARRYAMGGAVAVLLGAAIWTRAWLAGEEALWRGAEELRRAGTAPERVFASWTWNAYYGFDRYLDNVQRRLFWDFDDFFGRWRALEYGRAVYRVRRAEETGGAGAWRAAREVPYRDGLLRRRVVKVEERAGDGS